MKTVKVTFPDGTVSDWPAKERLEASREIPPGPPQVHLEPIPNADWRIQGAIGGWLAIARD